MTPDADPDPDADGEAPADTPVDTAPTTDAEDVTADGADSSPERDTASDAETGGGESARDHVLVGYDGTPQSEAALEHVCERYADARVTVLYVINPVAAGYSAEVSLPAAASEWYETEQERAEETLEAARETAAEYDINARTAVEVGRPATAIVEYAGTVDADHVVLGSHGRTGVSRILLGSVAEAVMRRSPVPVTVVR